MAIALTSFDQLRQPRAMGLDRRGAVVEHELVRARHRCRRAFGSAIERADCAERDSAHSMRSRRVGGNSSLGTLRATSRDIAAKSNISPCSAAEARLQGRRLLAGLRMDESRAQDVRQLAHQMVGRRAERARLLGVHVLPGTRDEARRQRAAAVEQFAVDVQRLGRARKHFADIVVCLRAAVRSRLGPQFGQRPGRARGEQRANLPARAAARACASVRLRCRAVRRSVISSPMTARQRLHVLGTGVAVDAAPPGSRSAGASGRGRRRAAPGGSRPSSAARPSPARLPVM